MNYKSLEEQIGYNFKDERLIQKALTHKSFISIEKKFNNEQLEFLGDAVLDLVFSEWLMELCPSETEGDLSKKRASFVNEKMLSDIATEMRLEEYMILGKGEILSDGGKNPRLLASVLEAIIGGLFLDSNYETTRSIVKKIFINKIQLASTAIPFEKDFKTRLQEYFQKHFKKVPNYRIVSEDGPPHERIFSVDVVFEDKILATAQGKTKKEAEQMGAQKALEEIYGSKV